EELLVEACSEALPRGVAGRLGGRVERGQMRAEERHDLRVAVLGRGHGLDHAARVLGMVVAVEADAPVAAGVAGEDAAPTGGAVAVAGLEEGAARVDAEGARVLALVDRVRARARGHEERAAGQRERLAAAAPALLLVACEAVEE